MSSSVLSPISRASTAISSTSAMRRERRAANAPAKMNGTTTKLRYRSPLMFAIPAPGFSTDFRIPRVKPGTAARFEPERLDASCSWMNGSSAGSDSRMPAA